MAGKKDNLPLTIQQDNEHESTITYANEVIAIIAGVATSEVEGIAGMSASGGIADIIGKSAKNKNITRGVRVEIGTEEASVDLYVIIEYGTPIQKAAQDAQENVRKAIETMTGLHVVRVDVHVQGVSFQKENQALESGQNAALVGASSFTVEAPPEKPFKVEISEDSEDKHPVAEDDQAQSDSETEQ